MAMEAHSPAWPAGGVGGGHGATPRIPDHDLLWEIGRGAYGSVWLARNVMGLRAVKIVERARFPDRTPYDREFEGIRRFEPLSREHEGFIDVLHVGKDRADEFFYYVMELADDARDGRAAEGLNEVGLDALEGFAPKTLKALLARPRADGAFGLPDRDCIAIARQLLKGLAHLHQRGLVHRDIKPSNILFANGAAKLADIGLVTGATGMRSSLGSAHYLAPEGSGAGQADIFALGMVLYQMVTGHEPEKWPGLPQGFEKASEELKDLNRICMQACSADPEERYATADEMLADVELAANKRLKRAESLVVRQRRIIAWLASLVVLTGAALSLYFFKKEARAEHRAAILSKLELEQRRVRDTGWFLRFSSLLHEIPNAQTDPIALSKASTFLSGLDASALANLTESSRFAAFSPQGEVLFGGAEGYPAKIISTNGLVTKLASNFEGPVAWNKNGLPVQFVSVSNSLAFIDPRNLAPIASFVLNSNTPVSKIDLLGLEAHAQFAIASTGGKIVLWSIDSPAPLASVAGAATAFAFSPDARHLAVGDAQGGVRIFSVPTLTEEKVIPAKPPGNPILAIAFGRNPKRPKDALDRLDGWRIAIGDRGARIEVQDLFSDESRLMRGSSYIVSVLAFSPDGCTLASGGRNAPFLWDIDSARQILNIGSAGGDAATAIAFDSTGSLLAYAALAGQDDLKGSTAVWRLQPGRGIKLFRGLGGAIQQTWISPDSRKVAGLSEEWSIGIWDIQSDRLDYVFAAPTGMYVENAGGCFSPDSTRFAFASLDEACLYDLARGSLVERWPLPRGFVNQVHCNADGSLLLLRAERPPPELNWKLRLLAPGGTIQVLAAQRPNGESTECLQMSPDGRWFLAGMVRGTRKIVRAHDRSGAALWETEINAANVFRFSFDETGSVFSYFDRTPWPRTFVRDFPRFQTIGVADDIFAIAPGGRGFIGFDGSLYFTPDLNFRTARLPLQTDFNISKPSETFSPNGQLAAWGLTGGQLAVADLDKVTKALRDFSTKSK